MRFWISAAGVFLLAVLAAATLKNEYYFFAGYTVLMFVVLATAWNILGGYAGYVNFGTPAFFGLGAYTAAVLFKAYALPLALQIVAAAAMSGLLGLAAVF
jgi:branched-chain amino acid transport system permease protein